MMMSRSDGYGPLARLHRQRAHRGQAVVEMTVVLPVLVILTLGVIEFGFLLNSYISIVNMAREGARGMLDGATNCEVRDVMAFEGNRRLAYTANGVTHIVRGVSDSSGNISASDWHSQPDPTANKPVLPLKVTRTELQNSNLVTLDGTTGINFVVVEVHYRYPAITRFPGVDGVDLSSRTFMRINQTQTASSNSC